jgi:hypothetical protein
MKATAGTSTLHQYASNKKGMPETNSQNTSYKRDVSTVGMPAILGTKAKAITAIARTKETTGPPTQKGRQYKAGTLSIESMQEQDSGRPTTAGTPIRGASSSIGNRRTSWMSTAAGPPESV